ncbi:hypothetical protein H112_08400 [Trichophyton rubrum D6]|uniref:Uncharacterized protein n=4 Tax=Trichophyton TaxID=5550 RepID=A0A178ESH6_TRIRU|nr:uncharacterized protein TERG_00963 [Trichophyton rubrum CBS 118892]EZF10341.1 hypothetical protein H100_08422 [Trichophyton rubrum MR850]EZF37079.1 hypothetical protein H102_08382 [Trichophyton rubrum CBS 100081]EZF47642.1 hypothetical protein H103_08405 [Trichophyton rubrum CBS 288.86]EZF58431.1 hypothetical protein H104_08357 [Trichophyton rubrum CBS 289.86]EZF69086.1 hypothetical protein H105_08409 [Trichophyton soudanense CBS 452.61]EZF90394.1 hypothetical protein H113_08473 [Trichophy
MEQRVLSVHNKSLKRKHDESDLSEESVSPLSNPDQPAEEGKPEIIDQADVKPPGAYLHGNVANRFRDLDIRCRTANNDFLFCSHSPEHDIQPQISEIPPEIPTHEKNPKIEEVGDDSKLLYSTVQSTSFTNEATPEITDPVRLESPPPTSNGNVDAEANEESLTWDESEITGHHATDPNDDGYGLNGIGFKPSAEVAWARSQHRKDQVAEWKRRMASEAREARSRRRQKDEDIGNASYIAKGSPKQKRVKFDT